MAMKHAAASFGIIVFISLSLTACESGSRARQVMEEHKCLDCHTFKGKGGAVGPNLTSVGSRRSRDWITQQIRKPSVHNPDTAMPSFADRIAEKDISELADYLASQK